MVLAVRVVFAPLTDIKLTSFQLATFRRLSFKLRFQMMLFSVAGLVNLVMFGILEKEGPMTILMLWILWVGAAALVGLTLSELLSIAFCRSVGNRQGEGSGAGGSSGADQGTLEILDRATSARENNSIMVMYPTRVV